MSGHYIEVDFTYGYAEVTFICDKPAGAACRMVPDCDCEGEWHHTEACQEKWPDGPPLVATDYCTPAAFINEDCADELGDGKFRFPVTYRWDGDTYVWTVL